MAQPNFRLEPLLKIRRLEEDRAKRVVADRLREIQRVQGQLHALGQHMVDANQTMRSLVLADRIVPREASRQRGYIGSLTVRQLETNRQIQAQHAKLAEERAALAEATKRRKILENLKDRQQQRRRRQADLAEQRAGDELGLTRFMYERTEDDTAANPGLS
jgi:flagellar export protein FliJ